MLDIFYLSEEKKKGGEKDWGPFLDSCVDGDDAVF